MTVAIDDLPPLIWHAELGDKLIDVWTGSNHRGVQLNDAREAVERWMNDYGQRCWLRQLTPYATREQEDRLLRVIARMDGTPFPSTARLTGDGFAAECRRESTGPGESRSWTARFANRSSEGKQKSARSVWKPLTARRPSPSPTRRWACWRPTRTRTGLTRATFWSGDTLPLAPGYRLGDEIAVAAIAIQSTVISASSDQPVASTVWLITFGVATRACGRSRCAALK